MFDRLKCDICGLYLNYDNGILCDECQRKSFERYRKMGEIQESLYEEEVFREVIHEPRYD